MKRFKYAIKQITKEINKLEINPSHIISVVQICNSKDDNNIIIKTKSKDIMIDNTLTDLVSSGIVIVLDTLSKFSKEKDSPIDLHRNVKLNSKFVEMIVKNISLNYVFNNARA